MNKCLRSVTTSKSNKYHHQHQYQHQHQHQHQHKHQEQYLLRWIVGTAKPREEEHLVRWMRSPRSLSPRSYHIWTQHHYQNGHCDLLVNRHHLLKGEDDLWVSWTHSQLWSPQGSPCWPLQVPISNLSIFIFVFLIIPDICLERHEHARVNFFLAGVNFYRFNAKNWQFTVYFAVITQKIDNLLCILS